MKNGVIFSSFKQREEKSHRLDKPIFKVNIWFYQLSWWCKSATAKSFKADIPSVSLSSERMNQLIKPNYLDIFAYLRNTTVSSETYPLYSFDFQSVSHRSLPTFYFFVDLTNVWNIATQNQFLILREKWW